MLSRFGKRPVSDIRKAILEYDTSILTAENVSALKEFAPEPEEIEMLKEYTGDKAELAKPEQYLMAVMDIPRLKPRLTSLNCKLNFESKADCIRKSLDLLSAALKDVKDNDNFKEMLEVVLALGNYLNGGTFRGGAYGFKLESLVKLGEVKTADNKMTLMHYLAQMCAKSYPHLLSLPEEMTHLQEATRESIPQNKTDITKLVNEVKQVESMLGTCSDDPKFQAMFGDFVATASKKANGYDAKILKIEKDFKEVAKFYGEPPSTDSQAFFDSVFRFLCAFDKAQKDNKRRKAMAEKQAAQDAKRAELADKQRAMGKKPIGGGMPTGGPLIGDKGLLDGLIANMRSGKAFVDPMERKNQESGGGGQPNFLAGLKKTKRPARDGGGDDGDDDDGGVVDFKAGLRKTKRPTRDDGGAPSKEGGGEINFKAGLKKTRRPAEKGPDKDEPEQPNFLAGLKKTTKPAAAPKKTEEETPNFLAGLKKTAPRQERAKQEEDLVDDETKAKLERMRQRAEGN